MQPMEHQMMGYDRAITMFSPDGRLLQVEYAKKTVKQGSTAIGLALKEGIVLVTDKRIIDTLVVADSVEKIWQIDDHIAVTAAGIISDARVLIENAQLKAQQNRITYATPIDTLSVVRTICNIKQICTQSGGLRPFGVSLLVAGVDLDGPSLYKTDPTGIYFQYRACAIGEGDTEVEEILKSEYKDTLSIEEGIKLCIRALIKVLDKEFGVERLDVCYIKDETKFVRVEKEQLNKLFAQAKKK